jgi:hypothetical protein
MRGHRIWSWPIVWAVALAGCDRPAEQRPAPAPEPSLAEGWTSGTHTQVAAVDHPYWELGEFHWQAGDRALSLGVAGTADQPVTPVYLLVARGRNLGNPRTRTTWTGSDNVLRMLTDFGREADSAASFTYGRLLYGETEDCRVGDRVYSIANGRVFLLEVDDRVRVLHQCKADLGGVFENRSPDNDAPGTYFLKLVDEINALKKADPRVRRFWDGEHPDAEEN